MSVSNHNDDPMECPLCMEAFELDDMNFYPCTCGYQICRFCWHRLRTDENGLCPACRKAYSENPADFKPLTQEELQHIKQEKRQKDLMKKQKLTENRKHLANVRVVQKNLVFVVGLSARLAEPETLKKQEYFGRFGKIHKVVINHTTTYAGSQGPSASAYVTYQRAEDALKAIQAVNNIFVDGRTLKASLGTTKYCSHFMKNQPCPKSDCMYLHELGDESASFTKEEMQQGKHQDLEKRLQEQYLLNPSQEKPNAICIGSGLCSSMVGSTNSLCEITATPPPNPLMKKTTKDLDPISDSLDENISPSSKDGWPALGSMSSKENSTKRSRSKSERNGSARQTPTEEHNKRNKDKKAANGKCGTSDEQNSASGSLDSGNSSASGTPPPAQNTDTLATDSPLNRLSPSSPVPVNRLPVDSDEEASAVGTTPSSLSSCSEPSSLPNAMPCKLSEPTSLYSENGSFFSLPQQHTDENISKHPHNISLSDQTISSEPKLEFLPVNANQSCISDAEWLNRDSADKFAADQDAWRVFMKFNKPEAATRLLDDELGFNIFEERTKALSEDILHEKKLLEQQQELQNIQVQKQLLQEQQQQLNIQKQLLHHQQQNALGQTHIRNFIEAFPGPKDLAQSRLPPPGFNGMSHPSYSLATSQQPQTSLNKILSPYMTAHQQQLANDNSSGASHQMNGFVGSNKLGVPPPGLGASMMNSGHNMQQSGLVNNVGNGISSHQMPNSAMVNYDQLFGSAGVHVANTQTANKPADPFVLKELESRIDLMRNLSAVNAMNTVNTLNTLAGNAQNHHQAPHNNPLTNNFYNMTQQQQQPPIIPFSSQHNMLQQLGNNAAAAPKGWNQNNGSDLTAMDPAIVSSGQLTDSRTDSPPLWMRTVEPIASVDGPSWNSMLPYGMMSGNVQANFGGVISQQPQQTQQRASMWPPTSPPPGFNSLSPLHHAKQREAHKIDNL